MMLMKEETRKGSSIVRLVAVQDDGDDVDQDHVGANTGSTNSSSSSSASGVNTSSIIIGNNVMMGVGGR